MLELINIKGATTSRVFLSPNGIQFSAEGHISECCVYIPYTGNYPDDFVGLECDTKQVSTTTYPMHSLISAMNGLEIASETCISLNADGMLGIQHQVDDMVGNGQPNFVDFIMVCVHEEEEREEEKIASRILQDYVSEINERYSHRNDRNEKIHGHLHSSKIDHTFVEANVDSETDSQHSETASKSTNLLLKEVSKTGLVSAQRSYYKRDKQRHTNRRRKKSMNSFTCNDELSHSDGEENKVRGVTYVDSSSSDESEFMHESNYNPGRRKNDQTSSPKLMYGDTHLEASDEDNGVGVRNTINSHGKNDLKITILR